MNDKICLLTGATSGIGQAGAVALASKGFTLWLVARDRAKAEATTALIKSITPGASVNWLYGDFSKLDDLREIARSFLDQNNRLDLLWHNAGICYNKRVLSQDGYEMMLAVNHLAPFLLTNLLFECLCTGDTETRVVVTASGAYKSVDHLNLDDMNFDNDFKTFTAYGNSKLSNILFTQTLASKLKAAAPQKIFTVNCFHPGFVGTGIGTQIWLGKVIMALVKPFVRSPEKGAETGLFLATDTAVEGKNGGYYIDCLEQDLKPHARDKAAAEMLWEKSETMVDADRV